jgi:hypothetical protein
MSYDPSNFPTSYKHPLYDELDAWASKKVGLDSDVLSRVRTLGEKTNADRVSEAGARSPYQIIPATREAIIEKYKIDPWLSPKNAALGAAYLLKESLGRNGNDERQAVGEYIGGTNRKNWGKHTNAYMDRVAPLPAGASSLMPAGDSDLPFLKTPVKLSAQSEESTNYSQAIADYKAGKMSPEVAQSFEDDVRSGRFVAPGLNIAAPQKKEEAKAQKKIKFKPEDLEALNRGIAWENSGKPDSETPKDAMNAAERASFFADIDSGKAVPELTVMEKIKDLFTGGARQTPETKSMPNFLDMPEFNAKDAGVKPMSESSKSFAEARQKAKNAPVRFPEKGKDYSKAEWNETKNSLMDTMARMGPEFAAITGSEEDLLSVAKKLKLDARRDEKGNLIMKSNQDGKDYIVPPGFTKDTAIKGLFTALAYTPAGRTRGLLSQTASMAGTEAALQAGQAAGGGDFSVADVGISAIAPSIVRAASVALGGVKQGVADVLTKKDVIPPVAQAVDGAAPILAETAMAQKVAPAAMEEAVAAAQSAIPKSAPTGAEMASMATRADRPGFLGTKGKQELAQLAVPDPEVAAAVERQGFPTSPVMLSEDIAPAMGLASSKAGSEAEAFSKKQFEEAAKHTYGLMDELGAQADAGLFSNKVAATIYKTIEDNKAAAGKYFDEVARRLPDGTPASTSALRELYNEAHAQRTRFSAGEKEAFKLLEDGRATYHDIESLRKEVGKAYDGSSSVFGSTDSAVRDRIYGALARDQRDTLEGVGGKNLLATYDAALGHTKLYKDAEEKIAKTYGKDLSGNLVPALRNAINPAVGGDDKALNKLLNTVPQQYRKEALMTAMRVHIQKAGKEDTKLQFEKFNDMWRGMTKNSNVMQTVKSTLGGDAIDVMNDIHTVTSALDKVKVLHTGKANQELSENMKGAEGWVGSVLDVAKRASVRGAATEAATSMAIGPTGVGFASGAANAILSGKKDTLKALGDLLVSPEFRELTTHAMMNTEIKPSFVKRVANSPRFKRLIEKSTQFSDEVKKEMLRDQSSRERFIMQAINSTKNMKSKEE